MPIIPQYQGGSRWARTQWKGTVVEHLWKDIAMWACGAPLLLFVLVRLLIPSAKWWPSPDADHPFFAMLLSVSAGWGHLLTLTTFTTTFFLGHAHAFWRKCYVLARTVQGRLNDVGMLCGSHAARTPEGVRRARARTRRAPRRPRGRPPAPTRA